LIISSLLGFIPRRLISDFDLKLIGGKARDHLNKLLVHVNAAPATRRHRNGLAERHWQTGTAMARNGLTSAELPGKFWFHAVKRAAEICNYFPLKLGDGQWITPLELAYKVKPDLRLLFKVFGVAAVCRERIGDTHLGKFDAQSIPMIAVVRCPNSNGLQFYNPANGMFVSSIDYRFQHHVTSGSYFGMNYQPGSFIYRLDESTSIFAPKFDIDSQVHVHTNSPPSLATVIGIPTYSTPDVFTVVFKDGSISEYTTDTLSETISTSSSSPHLLPSWIKGGANATLFLHTMTKPHHGKLDLSDTGEWHFYPDRSTEGILLPDLSANYQNLVDTGQLFKGHLKFKNVYDTRTQLGLKDCVLHHVSAHGLQSLIAPTSLKAHQKLSSNDQDIWNAAYDEEYDGLESLSTWEVISEEQYRLLSKGKRALPTMVIATIKYDANNRPKRAKYRLVVLGNLDYHTWSREATAAPVMSQLELRLLTSLAVFHRRVLKNCDVKQTFIQSTVPEGEEYFFASASWLSSFYAWSILVIIAVFIWIKRAPKLWYEMLTSHLKSMGLKNSENSPCIFTGVLIPGEPPIFVGIYVDDIIYFSQSDQVEKKFEDLLSTIGSVDFMGQIGLYLGTEFTCVFHPDGHLSVSLTQQSFTETLLDSLHIKRDKQSTYLTPYQSNCSIDSIPSETMSAMAHIDLRLRYQSLVGSLNWLAHTMRPDISTVVSLLAQHQSEPSPGQYNAALYVTEYLASTKTLGIYFTSRHQPILESFLHFPAPQPLVPMSDANWGP